MRNLQLVIGVWVLGSLPPTAAQASSPAGVWIVPDRVVLLPDENQPRTLQISGLLTLHSGTGPVSDWGYPGFEQPQHGTLFYTCAAGQEAMCKMQWRELAAALGSCVGFGSLTEGAGQLRAAVGQSDVPDVYPIGMGVVHGYTPCELLANAAASHGEDAGSVPAVDAATPPSAADSGAPSQGVAGKASQSTPAAQTSGAPSTPPPPPAAVNANPTAIAPDAGKTSPTPVHVTSGCSVSVTSGRPEPMAAALVLAALALRALRRRERHGR
jgi:MYXO-CTERM domain-containing protein